MTETILAHVLEPAAQDPAVRPQDDFYRHMNGHWVATHEIPADRPIDGAFYTLRDLSEKQCHEIAKDAVAGTIDDPDAQRIATVFSQFMDEDTIEAAGASPLRGEWSMIRGAQDTAEFSRLIGVLNRTGLDGLFGAYVNNDPNDTTRYILNITQSGLGLPDESYYREDKYADIRAAYVAYMARALTLARLVPEAEGEAAAQAVMEFETELASHHWDTVRLRDPQAQNNPREWSTLATDFPGFAWDEWATALGYDPTVMPTVIVEQPDFLAAACELFANTDRNTLRIWMGRDLVASRGGLLSSDIVDANFDFYSRTLSGTQELRPRWKRALSLVESYFGDAMGRLYVARHFQPAPKDRMDALVARLLDAYGDSIKALDWMGEDTKAKALEKLATFNPKIGYPVKWRDYSMVTIDPDASLVDNIRRATAALVQRELDKLGKPVDRDEWFMTPQTVNAYYNPSMNEIVFPAAILQPPFFDAEADDAVNFGGIGAVIGHEIGHGFDDQGSQYDAQGNLANWWTSRDREEFERRTAALVAQYDAFVPADLAGEEGAAENSHVNGELTLGENIGDLGGLSIAWKAWESALRDAGFAGGAADAPEIDGLSGAERFFASWARVWRTKARAEFQKQLLAVDPHSPAEFRCNGVARNLGQFMETYGVTEGDGMWLAPEDRVTIW